MVLEKMFPGWLGFVGDHRRRLLACVGSSSDRRQILLSMDQIVAVFAEGGRSCFLSVSL